MASMTDVFISYATADREVAQSLAAVLRTRGFSVWWDRVIPPGRQFDEVIEEALDGARCVAVLWSQTAAASTWVKTEAAEAMRKGTLVPAIIEPQARIPLEFRRVQAADLSGWRSGEPSVVFEQFCEAIARVVGTPQPIKPEPSPTPPPAPPPPDPPPVPLSYLGNLRERVDTPDPLDIKDQIALVFEIKAHFKEHGRAVIEDTRELLQRLKQRHDLLAKVAKEIDEILDAMNKSGSQGVKAEKGHEAPTPAPQASADAMPMESIARNRPPPERIRTGHLIATKSQRDGEPPSSVAIHEVAGVLSLVLSRTMNKGESWQIDADEHNRLVIEPLIEGLTPKIVVTATLRDNASGDKSTALKEMGWKVKDGGFTKGALGAAALYATSGLGALALLSKDVRDYFLTCSATKEWKKPRNDSEVSAIADELRLVLNRLAQDVQRITLGRCDANSLSGDQS